MSALALVIFYQNCSYIGRTQSSNKLSGNEGVDGKGQRYLTYGICPSNQVGVVNAIAISNGKSDAVFVRKGCQDLSQPQSVNVSDFTFVSDRTGPFHLAGQVYDQQVVSGVQQITLEVCQGVNGAGSQVQVQVWENYAMAGAIFGSVSVIGGGGTGVLKMAPPVGSPANDFSTAPGQASQLTSISPRVR